MNWAEKYFVASSLKIGPEPQETSIGPLNRREGPEDLTCRSSVLWATGEAGGKGCGLIGRKQGTEAASLKSQCLPNFLRGPHV